MDWTMSCTILEIRKRNGKRNMFQARQHNRGVIIATSLLLIVVAIMVFWILRQIKIHMDSRLAGSLQTVLDTTHSAIQNWAEQTEQDAAVLAGNDELRINVETQLRTQRNPQSLLETSALRNIRRLLAPAMRFYRLPGFAVIAPDGVQIAAESDNAVGVRDIADDSHLAFARAMAGAPTLGLPFISPLFVDRTTHREYPVMTAAAPIRDGQGNVMAVLALRLDPRSDFTRAVQLARLNATGETYIFDRKSRLLTESRFDDHLRKLGLIPPDAESILNLEVRDPGGETIKNSKPAIARSQHPLTRMAQSAVQGNSGIDLHGYRDYRGVTVIGTWLWDEQLRMGLATEMDLAEAVAPYRRVRDLVLFLFVLTAAVSIGFALIFRHRERLLGANAAFRQAVQARDDMMAIVAHDLKNPIHSMLLRCHVMVQLLDQSECQLPELKRNLESQRRTVKHMGQLISDLTDVARMEAGRFREIGRASCRERV